MLQIQKLNFDAIPAVAHEIPRAAVELELERAPQIRIAERLRPLQ